MLDRRPSLQPPAADIVHLARLVLEMNNFQYREQLFVQVKGTAMGTRIAPSYANVFMGCLEESILATGPGGRTLSFYGRIIDDVFGVWLFGEDTFRRFVEHANSLHKYINFTYSIGPSVNFLDTIVTINGDHLSTDLFTKPTDCHQYLLPSSNHPPHVHQHLPYGLAVRICMIVSTEPTLTHQLQELAAFLARRGYP